MSLYGDYYAEFFFSNPINFAFLAYFIVDFHAFLRIKGSQIHLQALQVSMELFFLQVASDITRLL